MIIIFDYKRNIYEWVLADKHFNDTIIIELSVATVGKLSAYT